MTISPERVTTHCPPWCDRSHEPLYDCAGEDGERNHFREVGRLDDGTSQLVVGIAVTTDPNGYPLSPVVELIHLDKTGSPKEELLAGEIYLDAAEALAMGPLLARAAELLAGAAG